VAATSAAQGGCPTCGSNAFAGYGAPACGAPGFGSLGPGCCECQPNRCSNAWDGYCQGKACHKLCFGPKVQCVRGCGSCQPCAIAAPVSGPSLTEMLSAPQPSQPAVIGGEAKPTVAPAPGLPIPPAPGK
jgi:hypothetical protein